MSSIDTFVRGIQRATERKQKATTNTIAVEQSDSSARDEDEHTKPAVTLDNEQYRIDLVNKIITHIRNRRKE